MDGLFFPVEVESLRSEADVERERAGRLERCEDGRVFLEKRGGGDVEVEERLEEREGRERE